MLPSLPNPANESALSKNMRTLISWICCDAGDEDAVVDAAAGILLMKFSFNIRVLNSLVGFVILELVACEREIELVFSH